MLRPDQPNPVKLPLSSRDQWQQRRQPLWFWPLLASGSALAHLLLVHTVGAAALQARHATETVTPIDLVELPKSASTSQVLAAQSIRATQAMPTQTVPTQTAAHSPTQATSVSSSAAKLTSVMLPPLKQQANPTRSAAKPAPEAVTPRIDAASQKAPAQPTATAETQQLAQEAASDLASPPLIATQRIDVPVPDVSGSLPASDSATPAVISRVIIPSHLVANLTTESLETDNPLIDKIAHPKTEMQTFSSSPVVSPCAVKPEAVQFLGKTVAMEVITDAKGQVVNTVMQQSSHNPAYDELATCLVQHWGFEPAIAQSEPVANDGLVVRITIDRGS